MLTLPQWRILWLFFKKNSYSNFIWNNPTLKQEGPSTVKMVTILWYSYHGMNKNVKLLLHCGNMTASQITGWAKEASTKQGLSDGSVYMRLRHRQYLTYDEEIKAVILREEWGYSRKGCRKVCGWNSSARHIYYDLKLHLEIYLHVNKARPWT